MLIKKWYFWKGEFLLQWHDNFVSLYHRTGDDQVVESVERLQAFEASAEALYISWHALQGDYSASVRWPYKIRNSRNDLLNLVVFFEILILKLKFWSKNADLLKKKLLIMLKIFDLAFSNFENIWV